MRLEGKVALITGGAHGMGAEECRLFAREGAKVVIADVLEEDGRQVEAEITEAGGEAMFVLLNVSDEANWESAVQQIVARFGKLDVLVNNAGVTGSGEPNYASSETWDRLMEVNAKGAFLGINCAIPEMLKAGGGSIVNISSISGMVGQEYTHPAYNASKGAVRLLTKATAVQHAKSNIRINSVHPGVLPPMLNSSERRAQFQDDMVAGGEAMFILLNVSDEANWESAVQRIVARFGKLDVLVNNAGVTGSGEPNYASSETWDRLMEVNAKGAFLGINCAIPEMLKAGGGSIVNISSISGMVGQEYTHPAYNASKGAVRLLTKATAVQHAKSNIRINSVHPGVLPPMLNSSERRAQFQDDMVKAVPMGREGLPIEVAYAVLFLASDEASYITGTELMVDGGFTAQ